MGELRTTPDTYLPHRYAGASGDFNPIHLDEAFAQAVGLPRTILHGLWTMAQVARAATAEGGGDPARLQRLEVQFRGMGFPEQELVVTATPREDDPATVDLVVEQGDRAIVRNATATLRQAPR